MTFRAGKAGSAVARGRANRKLRLPLVLRSRNVKYQSKGRTCGSNGDSFVYVLELDFFDNGEKVTYGLMTGKRYYDNR